MINRDLSILLVEDDEVEAETVERAFRRAGIDASIRQARDGVEALEVLAERRAAAQRDPLLVILDLNMPRMGGIEFLDRVRADAGNVGLLVFVVTTSSDVRDRAAAYDRNVAAYVVKGTAHDHARKLTDVVQQYRKIVEFPPAVA